MFTIERRQEVSLAGGGMTGRILNLEISYERVNVCAGPQKSRIRCPTSTSIRGTASRVLYVLCLCRVVERCLPKIQSDVPRQLFDLASMFSSAIDGLLSTSAW
jgi:hypothetical protein